MANCIFNYFDAESYEKAVHLIDVYLVSTCKSMTQSRVLSPPLRRYRKSWKNVAAVVGDSAEHMKKAVRGIWYHENLSILCVRDLPPILHATLNANSLLESVADDNLNQQYLW